MTYDKEQIETAYHYIESLRGQKVGVSITSVSKSGMSRRMRFYGNDFEDFTWAISRILGYSMNDKGIRVDGCGMDMTLDVLYNINYAMSKKETGDIGSNYSSYFLPANSRVIL